MHDFLIAVAFLSIVLAPCAAALWNRSDPAFPGSTKFRRGILLTEKMEVPSPSVHDSVVRCTRKDRFKMLHRHEVSVLAQQAAASSASVSH